MVGSDALLDLIRTRRSVRRYTAQPVDPAVEDTLLEAFRWSPSAGNAQPWHVVAVRDVAVRQQLARAALGQAYVAEAPLVLAICVDLHRARMAYGERGVSLYCLQDTAAAAQNVLLQAEALGLATCWVGAFQEGAVAKILGLPETLRPVALICVGHGDESPRAPERRPVAEISQVR